MGKKLQFVGFEYKYRRCGGIETNLHNMGYIVAKTAAKD